MRRRDGSWCHQPIRVCRILGSTSLRAPNTFDRMEWIQDRRFHRDKDVGTFLGLLRAQLLASLPRNPGCFDAINKRILVGLSPSMPSPSSYVCNECILRWHSHMLRFGNAGGEWSDEPTWHDCSLLVKRIVKGFLFGQSLEVNSLPVE
eukprot:scaffold24_cov341-Pavlova_lutheri.AAC.81